MKVCIAGASGFIGSHLRAALLSHGWTVTCLGRGPQESGRGWYSWDPAAQELDVRALDGVDAVINLAGKSIDSSWSKTGKTEMVESRVQSTRLLAEHIAALPGAPIFVSASAVGIYGDRGGEVLTEDSACGSGFLADLCRSWEEAAERAAAGGSRVVIVRIGVVLSPAGGILKKLLPMFRFGAGAVLGDGRQYMSWIALPDFIGIVRFCIDNRSLSGVFNAAAPEPVANVDFSTILAQTCGSKIRFAVPAVVLRTMLPQKAEQLLLSSQRAVPARLQACGFRFSYPGLSAALAALLAG